MLATRHFSAAAIGATILAPALCLNAAVAAEITGDANTLIVYDAPENATSWRVMGPDYLTLSSESTEIVGDGLPDGHYKYEVMGYSLEKSATRSQAKEALNNGRGANKSAPGVPVVVVDSGSFTIADGSVVDSNLIEP